MEVLKGNFARKKYYRCLSLSKLILLYLVFLCIVEVSAVG